MRVRAHCKVACTLEQLLDGVRSASTCWLPPDADASAGKLRSCACSSLHGGSRSTPRGLAAAAAYSESLQAKCVGGRQSGQHNVGERQRAYRLEPRGSGERRDHVDIRLKERGGRDQRARPQRTRASHQLVNERVELAAAILRDGCAEVAGIDIERKLFSHCCH